MKKYYYYFIAIITYKYSIEYYGKCHISDHR